MSIGATAVKPVVEPKTAVARFLKHMAVAARKSFPAWEKTLLEGLDDCALTYDLRHALIEVHPLDDYYFAGTVAMEAAKIRRLFAPDEASELLSLIAEHVDKEAGRTDRVVSDLVFFIIGRLEQAASVDKQKTPHDETVKALLQKLGLDRVEKTAHLMRTVLYRHQLGEPLALGVPQWWQLFRTKYSLTQRPETSGLSAGPAKQPRRAPALV